MELFLISNFFDDLRIALTLFLLVWVYAWAKGNLGDVKLAILFAVIIIFLTVYTYPELVWIWVALFILSTFGKDIFAKIHLFEKK